MIPLSFHTGFLSDYSTVDAIRTIRDHGYELVELNAEVLPWGPAHISLQSSKKELSELANLGPYSSLCIHHCDLGHASVDRRDASIAWTVAMMDKALDLGIDIVHVIPSAEATTASLHESLKQCVEAADSKNLTFAIEPIVGRVIGTTETALDAIAAAPGLKINFDPSHLHPMGDDVLEAAEALFPHVAHVHIKDAIGTVNDFKFVPLGTGEIDLQGLINFFVKHEYQGAVSVEHESHWFAGDDRLAPAVLSDCRNFFDGLLQGAAS